MAPFPLLVVKDLMEATRWYQETLGFRLVLELPGREGKPVLAHLNRPGHGDLLLVGDGRTMPIFNPNWPRFTLTFSVPAGSVDRLSRKAETGGAAIRVGPVDQPWHRREVILCDPDGHQLAFVQE
ncbi:MAG: VOC family protein [Bryobacteraceae bacterium]